LGVRSEPIMKKFAFALATLCMANLVAIPFDFSLKAAPVVLPVVAALPAKTATPTPTPVSVSATFTNAKYEPRRGVYLGVALNYSHLSGPGSSRDKMAAVMRDWEAQAGRKHAIYTQFLRFPHSDGAFPAWDKDPAGWASAANFCDAVASVGGTPLLTLEPMQPDLVARNWQPGTPAYDAAQAFAQAAGRWGKPLFIRFAHEMNGSWYPWCEWRDKNKNLERDPGEESGFTPQDYRAAYRNVALLLRRLAPNVALVWCPNSGLLGGGRRDPFAPFYPGDDVVDWVGLDFYERGFTKPMPGDKLWGGQVAYNITHDANDDKDTPDIDESVNFYQTYAVGKKKPMMICETAASLSYRSDLLPEQRASFNHLWKTGVWNGSEYGWMQGVYGTSNYPQKQLKPIDTTFPLLKAITWFQVAKREWIPTVRTVNGVRQLTWFENAWTDYRIGGGTEENGPQPYLQDEFALYRKLTAGPYFLSSL
jgi:Glycosyl hydrolase family 26